MKSSNRRIYLGSGIIILGLSITIATIVRGTGAVEDVSRNCDFRAASPGKDDDYSEYERTEIVCSRESPFCFAFWRESNETGEVVFLKQGCWGSSPKEPCESDSCITTVYKNSPKPIHNFCCCSSNNCNNNVTVIEVDPPPPASWRNGDETEDNAHHDSSSGIWIWIVIGASVAIIFSLFTLTILSYIRKKKENVKEKLENIEAGEKLMEPQQVTDDNWEVPDQVVLGQELARGKFGTIYSGLTGGCKVALKLFTTDQREFYVNERFIYQSLGDTCGKNILKYHGWKEFSTLTSTNLILVLDKIVPGNLRDFLTGTNLTVVQALKLMKGITNGLSFLHGENKNGLVIAHRDLTSKNILVNGNYTAYISDFGLSLQTCGSKYYFAGKERQAEFNSLAEAGTLRYMAPELLEGAVNLKDCENALKQVDIYATALLLWEIGNVCSDLRLGEDTTYALPYEVEIGKDITMETLTRFVVTRRDRPSFSQWRDTAVSRAIRDTLNESWDAEPDARLTALCIVERLNDIQVTSNKSDSNSTTPLETVTSSPWAGRNSCLERNLLDRSDDKSTEYLLTSEKHRNPFYGNNSSEGESMVTMNTDLSNGSGLTPTVVGPTPIPFLQNIRRV